MAVKKARVWTGTEWAELSSANTDLTNYYTKAQSDVRYQVMDIKSTVSTSYTLQATDINALIPFDGTFTVTVPPESTYNFTIGTVINLVNIGTGTITIAGGSGVTVNGNPGLKISTQWSGASLVKRGSNLWLAIGDLTA